MTLTSWYMSYWVITVNETNDLCLHRIAVLKHNNVWITVNNNFGHSCNSLLNPHSWAKIIDHVKSNIILHVHGRHTCIMWIYTCKGVIKRQGNKELFLETCLPVIPHPLPMGQENIIAGESTSINWGSCLFGPWTPRTGFLMICDIRRLWYILASNIINSVNYGHYHLSR